MPLFDDVFGEELSAIEKGATRIVVAPSDREPFVKEVSRELSGIALSGGGIRSATFNLGLLQGLDEIKLFDEKKQLDEKLLSKFDYLATVSGGGYIGSFWSAWRARNGNAQNGPFPVAVGDEPESQPVRHLREFSRFLAARWGLFELETWQFFAALATAIVPVIGVGIAVIALIIWFVLGVTSAGYAASGSNVLLSRWLPGSDLTVAGARLGLFEIETWQFFAASATAISSVIGVGPVIVLAIAANALAIWFVLGVTSAGYATPGSNVLLGRWLPLSDLTVAETLVGLIALVVLIWFEKSTLQTEYRNRSNEYPWKTYMASVLLAISISSVVVWGIHRPSKDPRAGQPQAAKAPAAQETAPPLARQRLDPVGRPIDPEPWTWPQSQANPPQQRHKASSKRVFEPGIRWQYFELFPGLHPLWIDRLRLFAPAAGWLVSMLFLILIRTHLSRWISEPKEGFYRAALDRTVARLLGMAVFWTVMLLFLFCAFVLWTRFQSLAAGWGAGIGAGSGGLYSYAQRLLSRQPTRARTGFLSTLMARFALPLLATTALVSIALAVTCGLYAAIDSQSMIITWATVGGPIVVIAFAVFFYNPNEIGMHSFYRSRLARAYLGASNAASAALNRQSTERDRDDLPLSDLPPRTPVHLVCCAANDLGGNHLANLSRGARSATLSQFGFTLSNRYEPWDKTKRPTPTLATAMTASAAAFNSNMGSLSMELGSATTFLMAMLNLRLGYWFHFDPKDRERRIFPGLGLLNEMFSQTRSDDKSQAVHLSDGGHFEDLALYELLRRRCKYIIASDCGADPEVVFDDVGNALRRAREDFGVEVEIDLSVLKPNEKNASRQHVAVGDIIYPNADRGILLLFKPTLVGDEPGDVLQYRARNQSFPHESTGDQFYDEKQWESYRRLGLHAARTAFHFLTLTSRQVNTPNLAEVFGAARWEWLPVPSVLQEQFLARSSELANIEQQLVTAHPALMRDLYPEIAWPDGTEHSSSLNATDLAKLIPLFTQVIQLMEDVYVSCIMERYWSHPLNVGWVNLFGRWATTPAFRDWWPILSPMYSPRVSRFIEEQFKLPSTRTMPSLGGTIDTTNKHEGVAWEIWESMHRKDPAPPTDTLWRYEMKLESGRKVNTALMFVTIGPGGVSWKHEDFFVPPSFWGARIGQLFLKEIQPGRHLSVTIEHDPAHRKAFSDAMQLYREAGFQTETMPANAREKGKAVMVRG
ncbi:MAG: hypothetical protein QOC81_5162 [Thermoanaerobaculia bacterium]|jgi:hypothetical protein|nr:hypothetical protein [Thermoanaerobaculia bacterium]